MDKVIQISVQMEGIDYAKLGELEEELRSMLDKYGQYRLNVSVRERNLRRFPNRGNNG